MTAGGTDELTPLVTDRLMLRPCVGEDAPLVFGAEKESLEELKPWFWWCHPEHTFARCERWASTRRAAWENDEEYAFVCLDRATGDLVGCAWINAIDRRSQRGSIGYWVRTSRARQGLAAEAVRAVIRFGFDRARLRRLEIVTGVENRRSQRVAECVGARFEGIARHRLLVGEVLQDAHIYSVLPEDL
jgi:RimJ/RimL family protein N-acetyltransferase